MSETGSIDRKVGAENSVAANVLSKLITAAKGTHPPSYKAGYKRGFEVGRAAGVREASVAKASEPEQKITILIEDVRSDESVRISFDGLLLDDARLQLTPALIKAFKADTLVKLGEDHQPTDEQWKAILAPSTSAATVGIAGTGKTFVMMMRAVLLHCYLEIPLDEMTILAVTKDCRFEVIGQLTQLFAAWGVQLSSEQGMALVKTPRGALLNVIRSVGPLRDVVPFELMGCLDKGDEDGRPFDPRLSAEQLDLIEQGYQQAYARSAPFADSIKKLFISSVALPRLSPDNAALNRYSERGLGLIGADELVTRAVTGMWHAMGAWPVQGIDASMTPIEVMGSTIRTNGFIPVLDAYIVLGFPRGGDRTMLRPGAAAPLFEEALCKRALLQRYADVRIIWVESPEQIKNLLNNAEDMGTRAPQFPSRLKGLERPMGVAECLYQTCALVETLGLNPSQAIANLKFMPHDPDAQFFDCAAKFWSLFESFLLEQSPKVMTFNRLFSIFGVHGHKNLKAVPTHALKCMRNVLTDELQDITAHTGEFIKACMAENRHRIEIDGIKDAVMSVYACGDDFQTAHGTQGATPKYLTEFKFHFPSKGFELNLLGVNFRSQQGIIYAAHSLILGIPAVSKLAPVSVSNPGSPQPIEVYELSAGTFMSLFDQHYAGGDSILILAANPEDYGQAESFINVVVDRDKQENPTNRRVRVRAAQRSKGLEADTVFIVGDFVAATSTWAKNQLFKNAKTIATEDQSPFDVIQQNELYRLAHIGITRARRNCYWLISRESSDVPHRLRASTRIASAAGAIIDHR